MENIPLENRKIIAEQSIVKIQNYMDCDVLQEASEQLQNAKTIPEAIEALSYVINCILYRYNERPEVEKLYALHLSIIKEMKQELEDKPASLYEAIKDGNTAEVAKLEKKAQAGEIIRII